MINKIQNVNLTNKVYYITCKEDDKSIDYDNILEFAVELKKLGGKVIFDFCHATMPNRLEDNMKYLFDKYNGQQVFVISCNYGVQKYFDESSKLYLTITDKQTRSITVI